jgi:hypothetical protein
VHSNLQKSLPNITNIAIIDGNLQEDEGITSNRLRNKHKDDDEQSEGVLIIAIFVCGIASIIIIPVLILFLFRKFNAAKAKVQPNQSLNQSSNCLALDMASVRRNS